MNNTEINMNGGTGRSGRLTAIPVVLSLLTVGLTALTAFLFSAGLPLLGVLASAICAGAYSTLLASSRSALYILVVPAAFAAAFFTGGVWCAAYSVAYAGVASTVLIAVQKKANAASAVNFSAVTVGVFVAAVFTVSFALSHGGLSAELIKTEFNGFFAGMKDDLTKLVADSGYSDMLQSILSRYGLSSEDLISSIVTTVKYISPSLFIAAVWLYSFVSVQFFKLTVFILSLTLILPDPKWKYEPSVISARIYLADYFLYLFTSLLSGGFGVISITVENLLYILLMPMIAAGISSVAESFRNPALRGRMSFTAVLLIAALIFLPTVFLYLLAMIGAFYVIFGYKRRKAREENKKGGDGE